MKETDISLNIANQALAAPAMEYKIISLHVSTLQLGVKDMACPVGSISVEENLFP